MDSIHNNIKKMLLARKIVTKFTDFKDCVVDNIYICIIDEEKIGIKTIKNIENIMNEKNVKHTIMIHKSGITSFAKQYLKDNTTYNFEIFHCDEFKFSLLDHELIPEVCTISNEESSDLLIFYKTKDSNLPRIQQTDPVVRYLGAKKGEILRFTRPSESAGVYSYWRIVH